MAVPIEYQILKDLQAALRNISTTNGFFYDVQSAAVKLDADAKIENLIGASGDRPFIILEVTPGEFTYYPSGDLRLALTYVIHFVNEADPTDDDNQAKTFYQMCSDAEVAITADRERGGLAVDTLIRRREMREFESEGRLVWSVLLIEVDLHRNYGEPNG